MAYTPETARDRLVELMKAGVDGYKSLSKSESKAYERGKALVDATFVLEMIDANAGSGGTDDHAALTNLQWTASGHIGGLGQLAGFNAGTGTPEYVDPAGYASPGDITTAISAHEGASDPHPGYALESSLSTVATTGAYGDLTGAPTIPEASDADPHDLGTVAAGASSDFSRADHVHEMPDSLQDIEGLAPADGDMLMYDAITGHWIIKYKDSTWVANGFVDGTDAYTTLTFTAATRTLTISPVGTDFVFFADGSRFISTGDSVVIGASAGLHIVYFDTSGVLQSTTSFPPEMITERCLVAIIAWSPTGNRAVRVNDERHGLMQPEVHRWIHYFQGTQLRGSFTPDMTHTANPSHSDATVGFTGGTVVDEDIWKDISAIAKGSNWKMAWVGPGGEWMISDASPYACISPGLAVGDGTTWGGSRAAFNDASSGTLQNVSHNNDYVCMHVLISLDQDYPILWIVGQAQYTRRNYARAGAVDEINQLQLSYLETLSPEYVIAYTMILRTNSGWASPKAAWTDVDSDGNGWIDHRTSGATPGSGATASDHAGLTNLQWTSSAHTDADDPGYAKHAGWDSSGVPTYYAVSDYATAGILPHEVTFDTGGSAVRQLVCEYYCASGTEGNYYLLATITLRDRYNIGYVWGHLQASGDNAESFLAQFQLSAKQQSALGSDPAVEFTANSRGTEDLVAVISSVTATESVVQLWWRNPANYSSPYAVVYARDYGASSVYIEETLPAAGTPSGTAILNLHQVSPIVHVSSEGTSGHVYTHTRDYTTGASTAGNYYLLATVTFTERYKHVMLRGTVLAGADGSGGGYLTTFSMVAVQQYALGNSPVCSFDAQSGAGGEIVAYISSVTATESVVELYWLNPVSYSSCLVLLQAQQTTSGVLLETPPTLPSAAVPAGTQIPNTRAIPVDGNGYATYSDLREAGATGSYLSGTYGPSGGGAVGVTESTLKYTGTYLYSDTVSESVKLGATGHRWGQFHGSKVTLYSTSPGNTYLDLYRDTAVGAPVAGYMRLSTTSGPYLHVQGGGVYVEDEVIADGNGTFRGGALAVYCEGGNPASVWHKTASSVDVATSYYTVTAGSSVFTHQAVGAAGTAPAGVIFKVQPDYGTGSPTSNGFVEFFSGTSTSGDVYLSVFKGDGTVTKNAEIGGQGRDTYFCADSGSVAIGKSTSLSGVLLDADGILSSSGSSSGLLLAEMGSVPLAPAGGYGIIWENTSNELMFTSDSGTDETVVTSNGSFSVSAAKLGAIGTISNSAGSSASSKKVLSLHFSGDSAIGTGEDWIQFSDSSGEVGRIHSEVVYGTFTGGHETQYLGDATVAYEGKTAMLVTDKHTWIPGMIVCSTGEMCGIPSMGNALPAVDLATEPDSTSVYGVYVGLREVHSVSGFDTSRPSLFVHALGEGQIMVCDINGPVRNGDLIVSSALPGVGARQEDDIMRSSTVAKCTQTLDWGLVKADARGVRVALIACTYHCG